MAKLVTQGAEERAERGYLLADCSPPPNADHERAWMVIAEELRRRIFADSKRPGGKDPHAAFRHTVEHRRGPKKFGAGSLNIRRRAILHSPLDKLCACEQTPVRRQRNEIALIAVGKCFEASFWRTIREHPSPFSLRQPRKPTATALMKIMRLRLRARDRQRQDAGSLDGNRVVLRGANFSFSFNQLQATSDPRRSAVNGLPMNADPLKELRDRLRDLNTKAYYLLVALSFLYRSGQSGNASALLKWAFTLTGIVAVLPVQDYVKSEHKLKGIQFGKIVFLAAALVLTLLWVWLRT